ncbi:probable disease resistance protein At5g45490 [Alnus glutinosa]|uniref:probable disease resistance protein At5g45490 n=1 Tax=Alnus glutinosa TaxID=3517 RepID=UPI002D78E50A|nr:probable disease resistance protein At5g45490 [Alnus glutinosa]
MEKERWDTNCKVWKLYIPPNREARNKEKSYQVYIYIYKQSAKAIFSRLQKLQIDMAKEIDEFLMMKFRDGLDEIEKSKNAVFRPNFLFDKHSIHNNFLEIKDLPGLFRTPPPPAEHIKIRENLYCLNDVLTEYQMMSKTDLITGRNIWKKLTNIKAELNRLKKDSNRGSKQPDDHDVKAGSPTALPFDESKVYGFKDDVTSLEKVLVRQGSEDRFKNVGIIGKAGIGKTALCQSLFNKKEVKDYFHPRIWVCMSRQPAGDDLDGKVTILKRMLVSLGVEDEIINKACADDQQKLTATGLLYALHLQLQGKRYLIVLDDACPWDWETDEWYKQLNSSSTCEGKWDRLAYGLPKGFGGAVIVTSRDEKLAKEMVGPEGIVHSVLPLSDPESSWNIFKNGAAEPDFDSSINKDILKEQILRKCAGLPLTALMMGTAYQNRPAK